MARMPKYERIRNKKLNLFARVDKPGRLWTFLNSAIFLWFLTAAFVSVGGSYFSQVQKCIADGETLTDRFSLLTQELSNRDTEFGFILHNAESINALISKKAQYKSWYSEFQGKDGQEIEAERLRILRRAEPLSLSKARDAYQVFPNEMKIEIATVDSNQTIFEASKAGTPAFKETPANTFLLRNNCSVLSILKQLLYGERYVLRAVVQPN
jgi:hypothetical protein